jgi:hypothetical protein
MMGKTLLSRVRKVASRVSGPVERLAARALSSRHAGSHVGSAMGSQVVENAFSRWRALGASAAELAVMPSVARSKPPRKSRAQGTRRVPAPAAKRVGAKRKKPVKRQKHK